MQIGREKKRQNKRNFKKAGFYQSKEWRGIVKYVWERDKHLCQHCKEKGMNHYLTKGSKDVMKQGTVDHIVPRIVDSPFDPNGQDHPRNLRLIGSNHHASKSSMERRNINKN